MNIRDSSEPNLEDDQCFGRNDRLTRCGHAVPTPGGRPDTRSRLSLICMDHSLAPGLPNGDLVEVKRHINVCEKLLDASMG